jgi:DUF4097 and DUF4098 domain-containing protein YvlB
MKHLVKLFIIISIIGILIAMIGIVSGFDFLELKSFFNDDDQYTLENYIIDDEIENLKLDLNDRNITVTLIDSDELLIRYYKKDNETFNFTHNLSNLSVYHEQEPKIMFFNYKITSPSIKTMEIEVPISWNLNLDFYTKTGNINISIQTETFHFFESIFQTNTGNINITNLSFDNLELKTNTGNQTIKDSIIQNDLKVKTDTGNVVLTNITTSSLVADVQTGNVNLLDVTTTDANINITTGRSTINDSVFTNLMIKSTTGRVNINKIGFEDLNITTSTGDVYIFISNLESYKLDLRASTGKITVNDVNQGNIHNKSSGNYQITIRVTTGSIKLGVLD